MKTIQAGINKYSHIILIAPFVICFFLFIIMPTLAAVGLSFTRFNTIQAPEFIGLRNYAFAFTQDELLMQRVLPYTLQYALIVGPGGYLLAFILAWLVSQLTRVPRTILTIILFSPTLTGGVFMGAVWQAIFAGDQLGHLNALLLRVGIIDTPIAFLSTHATTWLMPIMIVVGLWSSMGVGFLAIISGILNVDPEQYEAAYIDGVRNRFQEVIYVTIPNIRPQMLFAAVMAIVGTFSASGMGVALTGSNPTPQYAGQVIVNHIEDFGFIRYEMGYAAALSVILLGLIYLMTRVSYRLFGDA